MCLRDHPSPFYLQLLLLQLSMLITRHCFVLCRCQCRRHNVLAWPRKAARLIASSMQMPHQDLVSLFAQLSMLCRSPTSVLCSSGPSFAQSIELVGPEPHLICTCCCTLATLVLTAVRPFMLCRKLCKRCRLAAGSSAAAAPARPPPSSTPPPLPPRRSVSHEPPLRTLMAPS